MSGLVLKNSNTLLLNPNGTLKYFAGDSPSPACCCVASSSGSTEVFTCCCANSISKILKLTFGNDGTGIFADLDGVELILVFNEAMSVTCEEGVNGDYIWLNISNPIYNEGVCVLDTYELHCSCPGCEGSASAWTINVGSSGDSDCWDELSAPSTVQCDPFLLTGTAFNATTGDTISYEITEA